MHRFFVPGKTLAAGNTVDIPELARQLRRVLRLQPGDTIGLLDGEGALFRAVIVALDESAAAVRVLDRTTLATEPPLDLTLYQCSLKADKFEWVLQKGTELGVTRFVPVISARSIVRPAAALCKKYARWHAIIREAAEQSGRARLPTLDTPLSLPELVQTSSPSQMSTLTSPPVRRFIPWEDASDAPPLGAAVTAAAGDTVFPRFGLLIGPEGGFQGDEIDMLRASWQVVTLGPRILRAETAALAAVTILMERCGGF